ncbi:FAD-dependent oxidoreductase [Neiella sp. HB171785]|uniref:FAD-dependent oxidoreductase n=1 Tax=Neiella litorisoli TaxID=2771431 RepID=A0A8J6UIH8_9GAMM|nr:FAD-dependent oxidoreductase [Neiella litorisoli]MBD1388488.1 FAD-dependent oxidoreductase [Neiella litorisoli]
MTRVAVIGAGIAGLCAARELQGLGYDVDVFEKSRGRGGRLASKRLSWATVDTGAQYFTARAPRFRQQVKQWLDCGAAQRWTFTPHKMIGGQLQLSPDDTERFVGTPNMNSIAHHLAANLKLQLNVTVTAIERRHQNWYLTDHSGAEWGAYQWLVVAIPATQARQLVSERMPQAAAQQDALLPCWAVVLATKGSVCPTIQGVFGDDTVSWLSRLSAKPERIKPAGCDDVWLLHFSPQYSAQHTQSHCTPASETQRYHQPQQIIADAKAWLSKTLAHELDTVHEYHHFWRYAHFKPSQQQQAPLFDSKQRLAVIGDWCHGGRIEGAYWSAIHAVEQMVSR